ncbi:hypothetical protein [Litoribrevibacter albus]|uniref:Uncharacterized protein n=1 Tax=Litoribrevibacter albus TaxID=1473156 RepID=A0AA37S760_9GAMM|nr:hypothetical protein [Litoribrevibacter albus]GLQ30382.1 hypothetical protein GCM10007876_08600 [Litoribrevibacter albus]
MKKRLSELFSRLTSVNEAVAQKHGTNLINAIEDHQKSSFYNRHFPLTKDPQEQQLLAFYSEIVNQGLDSNAVLKTSKKIELVEKTLTDKTPILIPLELHVLISELNVSIAQEMTLTVQEGSSPERYKPINMPADYIEKHGEILKLFDELSQYIIQLLNDQSKIKFLKKSRLVFKTLGLGYFHRFISDYLALVENITDVSALNRAIITNELKYLESIRVPIQRNAC